MPVELRVVQLPGGKLLYFEQDTAPPAGSFPVGIGDLTGTVEFEAALDAVKTAAGALFEALSTLARPPDACELSFGLKLSAGAGFIVAKAQGEANFAVKMSWSPRKSS